jgi:hypothetical protein
MVRALGNPTFFFLAAILLVAPKALAQTDEI